MKQLKQLLLVMAIALTGFTPAQAQTPTFNHYSEWMAYARRNMVYTKKTPPYSDQDKYDGTHEVDWWRYDDGLMYESILDTYEYYKTRGGVHGSELLSGVQRYLNKSITGSSSSPSITNFAGGELDDMRPGRLVWKYCYTYDHSEDSKIDVYKAACAKVINANAFQDDFRVGYSDGHKDFPWQHKDNYTQQVWLDGIFMGIPYWTLAGPQIGSSQKSDWGTNATKFFDDAVRQMQVTDSTTFVPTTGLWCHAWDYTKTKTWADCSNLSLNYPHITAETTSGNNTGRSLHTWGRALGWYAMAIMETMDNITAVDANYAKLKDMKDLFKKVMDAVISYRDETSGVWYCVLDVGDNTAADSPYNQKNYPEEKKPKRNNYLEATCSSMFAYCLLHGVAKGYLDNSYLETAKDAYKKVVNNFITTSGDEIHLNNCMQVGGLDSSRDGSFAYYMSEPVIQDDSKGVGPFIWASLEAEKIGYNMETKSFDPIDENTIVTFAWSKASDEITNGDSYTSPTFTAKTYGNDTPLTNSETVDFASDNTSVATVGTNGTVTLAGGTGTAHITAELTSGSSYTWSGSTPTYTIIVNPADETAPTLSSSTPTNSATNVATSGNIVLTFDENVACTTNATLTPNGGAAINLTPTVSGTTVIYSYSGLSNEIEYTFNLAAKSVADTSGNNYANAITFSFTTKAAATETALTFFDGTNSSATVPGALNDVTTGFSCTPYNLKTTIQNCEYQLGSTQYYKSIKMGGGAASGPKNLISFTVPEGYTCDMYMVYLETSTGAAIGVGTSIVKPTTSNSSSFDVWHTAIAETNTLYSTTQSDLAAGTYYICPSGDAVQVAHLEFTLTPTSPTPSTFTLTNTVNEAGYGTVSPASVSGIASGTATSSSSNTYTVGGTEVTATPTAATAEYTYAFSGWSNLPETVTANKTVTAIFTRTANSYTLAWNKNAEDADDLTGNYTNGSTAYGTTLTPPSTPTRSGYTFNGWNSAQDGKGTALGETMPAANTTYYAQWTENTPVVEQVATPSITGTTPFTDNTTVTITCATSDANIYYTTNGDTPTSSCTHYTAPFSIDATTTIKAIAIKSGMTDSEVASATFTKSGGGGGTSATITYNLDVGTTASTTIKNSTSTTDATNITNIDIDQAHDGANGTGASDRTTKLAIKTGNNGETFENPTNYELFKFTIATGKQFTPSEIAIKVANVGSSSANKVKYKATLTDESSHSIDGTYVVTTGNGTVEDFKFSNSSNVAFTGNVTLKLWAWTTTSTENNASAFRMGTPLTITGTIEDSSEPIIPTYTVTATSNNNNWGTVSVDKATAAEGATVTITTSPASGYELTSLTATDGESNPVTITNNQFTMPASNVTVNATFAAMEKVATPSITGTTPFTDNTTVTITCATTGATIHYTTDDSAPTSSSATYSEPINISATTTVKAIAVKEGMTDSEVASATFTKSGGGGGGSGTVLFSQYFNDATEVAYAADNTARTITTDSGNNIVGTNSKTQFSYIGMTAKSGAGIAINSTTGGNSVNATGFFQAYCNATGQNWALVHNTDFADTAPTALKIDMKIYFQQLSSGSDYSVSFAVGDNFENGTSSPTSANVHSGFSILNNSTAKLSQYLTKTVIYDTGITQGEWQDVTWIINNNGEVLTYTDPKGKSSTVNNDCFDLWIGTTKVATNQAATTAATALQNLYIGDPAGKKNEFRLDEIVVTDLTPTEVAKVATPEITPADGTVFEGTTQNVSISCSTSGASIYYTLDGTDPTTSSIPYNSAFTIYGTKTVKAIAIKEGMTNSIMAAATITNTCLNEYTDGTLLLKQNATEYTPVAASGVTVTLERSLQANKWNPMCLPFDITPSMFSQTTQIETLQKVSNGVFTFAPTNSVPAGTPFIAKPAANIANPVFEDVEVKAIDAGSDIKDGYTFQGNYTKVTLDPETNLFISMSQQKLVSPTGSNILQGLRGYFIVPSGEGARFSLNFDGEMIVTDINRLNIEHLPFAIDDKTPIYNLSGQRVSKDYKGIVIINGKKFVRK